ncbi:MAG: ABC-F family ATP-binding cassette domain-containing protein [Clostridiales bacterium]|nr:ABC-F family ATP-binding cassette domain-containing protein [Clostridiales bacterium]
MMEISLNHIEKYYGANRILSDVNFEIKTGEKIGIIGRNGSGKTTLFKLISGQEEYQGGQLFIRKNTKIAYLNQIPKYNNVMKVIDVLKMPFDEIFSLQLQMRDMEAQMAHISGEHLQELMSKYALIQQQHELLGAYSVEEELSKIVSGFEFDNDFLNQSYELLSGGQKTLVEFAKILLEKADVLLLDEPTNHLDFKTIDWLEKYLKDYHGAVLIISHDRYFLDQVVTEIVELEDGKSEIFDGNYSYFIKEKERRYQEMTRLYENQQKKLKSMQQAVYRFREWGRVADSEMFFKKAKNMEKRIERMDKIDKPRINRRNLMINLKDQNRSGKEVLIIENLRKSFGDNLLFNKLNLSVFYQDSFALVGSNGSGKSTILKAVLNYALDGSYPEYIQDGGSIKIAKSAKIAFLEQEVTFDNEEITLLESLTLNRVMTDNEARAVLAGYLFSQDDVFKKIKDLSGGERSRLRLCHLLLDEVNFMILDEPTNHLDIPSREMLEEALMNFSGTIFFISHDRYFINRLAQEIYELDDKGLKRYIGGYEDYMSIKNRVETRKVNIPKKEKNISVKTANSNEKKSRNNYKINKLESDIQELEVLIIEIEEKMLAKASDYDELMRLTILKNEADEKYEKMMDDYLTLID